MPRALLSVYDKTGLIELAQGLHNLGWILLASGSTAKTLRENQLPVTEVADYTGTPEMLGGRVKTLHPAIHAGLLARATESDRQELLKNKLDYIDLVAVNLYPFTQTIANKESTLEDAIENIDIGGVTLIRAAAKNYQRVWLLTNPKDYSAILAALQKQDDQMALRKKMAAQAFMLTSQYDAAIGTFLADTAMEQLNLYSIQELRYGENPHQQAKLYGYQPDAQPLGGKLLQGKPLSYNNLLDLDAAWKTVSLFDKPTVCIVKHCSPCGVASAKNTAIAFQAALACDPVSAFGGVIASNSEIDEATVNAMGDLFVESIAAPAFSDKAVALLSQRTNCRLLEIKNKMTQPQIEWRSITAGLLQQNVDQGDPAHSEWKVVSHRKPTEQELESLQFAWKACQTVRSNAIVLARDNMTVGIGGGQPNRVDCVRFAVERAADKAKGSVMASDAFFPFADSIELAKKAGITAIVQPGGSRRDKEVIAAADAAGIAMLFSGVRHFRH